MSWDYTRPPLLGIDVSHHNGGLDMPAIRAAGISFVICKVTEGTGFQDHLWPTYRQMVQADENIVLGAYHFLKANTSVVAQVDYFLETLGTDPAPLLLCLDVELDLNNLGPTYAQVVEWVETFRDRLPGHPLLLYSGGWYWRDYLSNVNATALECDLWDSQYVSGTGSPAYLLSKVIPTVWTPYGGWTLDTRPIRQYSASGVIGSMTSVDLDAFWGTKDQLLAYTQEAKMTDAQLSALLDALAALSGKLDATNATLAQLTKLVTQGRNASFRHSITNALLNDDEATAKTLQEAADGLGIVTGFKPTV